MNWKPIHGARWSSWRTEFRAFLVRNAYPHESSWTDEFLSMCLVLVGLDLDEQIRAALWFNPVAGRVYELHLCVDDRLHGHWITLRSLDAILAFLHNHDVRAVMCCPSTDAHRGLVRRLGFLELEPIYLLDLHESEHPQDGRPDAGSRAEDRGSPGEGA